jgi:succinyl-CoA synthetase beta subunit
MLSSTASSLSRIAMATRRAAVPAVGAVRNINIHEYQSMELMKSFDIGIPGGHVASTPEEAENIYLNILNKRECCYI